MPDSPSNGLSEEFTPAYRLLRSVGYGRALKGKSVGNQQVRIFYSANGTNKSRLGIISSKRVFPLSSQRNFLKRTVREAFRRHSIKWDGLDLVVMPLRASCLEATQSNLEALFGGIRRNA